MKNDRWVFRRDIVPEDQGNGVVRRVLAYSDDVMVVENTFKKARSARSTATRTRRSPT